MICPRWATNMQPLKPAFTLALKIKSSCFAFSEACISFKIALILSLLIAEGGAGMCESTLESPQAQSKKRDAVKKNSVRFKSTKY